MAQFQPALFSLLCGPWTLRYIVARYRNGENSGLGHQAPMGPSSFAGTARTEARADRAWKISLDTSEHQREAVVAGDRKQMKLAGAS
jgi:hypothetical protein